MALDENHITIHVISRGPSVMDFREVAGIECESIQASSYHHSIIPAVSSLRPGFLIAKICDATMLSQCNSEPG